MDEVRIPWGGDELSFSVPEDWRLVKVAEPAHTLSSHRWQVRMAESLSHPVAGPSLHELLGRLGDGRLVFVIEDLTRNSPLSAILEIIMEEVRHAGVRDDRMEFVVACGMHPHADEGMYRERLCPGTEGIPLRVNPWHRHRQYANIGKIGRVDVQVDRGITEADVRILISHVSPHLQAGFGGGYKMFFPGCGELKSIRMLHRLGIPHGGIRQLVGSDPETNSMRQVIDRAGAMVDRAGGETFSVQYMLDEDDLPTHIAAGLPVPAHRMLTKKCAVEYGIVTEESADVVVTNAHPRDYDLWQTFKSIPNTCWAARPGGIVICMGRCEKGLNEMKSMPWPLSPRWTQKVVRFLGPDTITSLLDRIISGVAGDSQWFIRLATNILHRNTIYLVSPKLVADGIDFPGIELFASVDEALAAARTELGGGSQRLAVYPYGGASYPILQGRMRT